MELPIGRKKGGKKSNRRLLDVVKDNIELADVTEEDAEDRIKQKQMICCGEEEIIKSLSARLVRYCDITDLHLLYLGNE